MNEKQHEDWNPRDESVLKDQRQAYDEMRERCPVAYSKFMGWSLFRHEDISDVIADPETFSNASRFLAIPNGMDPPDHRKYHEVLAAILNKEQVAKLEPRARKIAENLFKPILSSGEAEFVAAFATPFALKTMCSLLGWPDQQWECLAGWVHGNQQAAFNEDPVSGKALAELFSEHVKTNLDMHRASPDNAADATNELLRAEVNGKRFNDEQIVSILRNWAAGHGTVVAGLSIIILHLAQEPELQNRLRSDPSLIPAAIEEILRVDGPLVANRRSTTREVIIHGKTIPKGENLSLVWIAANRDPRVFDAADTTKIERHTNDGMVWGKGIHICLGVFLARLEMRIAIEELLSRTKRIWLSDNAPQRAVYPSNGLATLQLRVS